MDVELLIHSVSSTIEGRTGQRQRTSFMSDNKKIRLHFGARTSTILLGCHKAGPVYEILPFSPRRYFWEVAVGVFRRALQRLDTISEQYL